MGIRDDVGDVGDGAQDRDVAGERQPWSPEPPKTPDPSQAPRLEPGLSRAPRLEPDPSQAPRLEPDPSRAPRSDGAPGGPAEVPDPAELPELLDLDLAELRTVHHPVLAEVLAELRTRSGEPSEILWGFNSAF
ncbi:FxSxx-COOH cyclophane-containing RiPP peptide [Streptomyces sp. NPDC058122]|uniref:FxSxx-COOH cyclophane-containing RiPP peptide n=1 Tax=Streptomyces sp. NPDC058122 TaxID=3346349 RepID=UPI0036E0C338